MRCEQGALSTLPGWSVTCRAAAAPPARHSRSAISDSSGRMYSDLIHAAAHCFFGRTTTVCSCLSMPLEVRFQFASLFTVLWCDFYVL